MGNRWIFVVLCVSFVGQLVIGSIFPSQDPQPNPPNSDIDGLPQEVPLSTAPVDGTIINTRTVYTDGTQENNGQKSEDHHTVIVINNEQKRITSEIVTIDKGGMETTKLIPAMKS